MGTRDPKVDAYINKAADFAKPILAHFRETVHAACPDVVGEMKWSFPHFTCKGSLCSMAAFKEHAAGRILEGVAGLLLVATILLDVFLTVVVPRRAPRLGRQLRVTGYLVPGLWKWWRWVGLRLSSAERREAFLGLFGALIVIVLLIAWVVGLVLGYGLLLDALRAQIRPLRPRPTRD